MFLFFFVNDGAIIRPRWLRNRGQKGTFYSGRWKPGHFSVLTGFFRDSGHATENLDCPGKTGMSGHPILMALTCRQLQTPVSQTV